ncbi:MAG: molybdopterin synthase sulfur carrier subunit [Phycisphaera sp.]|nr:molybdopterin synthase sulfur carrier subunit [Phycisphaera sp.]
MPATTTVTIEVPTALRPQANNQSTVEAAGGSVREVLASLTAQFPELGKKLFKTEGELNRFINIYVNDEDIRFMDNLDTPIKERDEVSIVPAIAGG